MAAKLLVAGVDHTADLLKAPEFPDATATLVVNNRSTATVSFMPGFLPNRKDEVVLYARDGVTPVYGGVVLQRGYAAIAPGAIAVAQAQCVSFWAYLDWAPPSSRVYAAPVTLKQFLLDLIADCDLSASGITLDPAQVVGPTLEPFTLAQTKASDAIRAVTQATGGEYVGYVDPSKVLSMFALGTRAAPVAITEADPHCDDFDWSDPTTEDANVVIVTCGVTDFAFVDAIALVGDGVTQAWTFDVGPESSVPYTSDGGGGTIHVAGVVKNMALGDFTWTTDVTLLTSTLTLPVAPGVGVAIDCNRNIQPPFKVRRASGAAPQIFGQATAPTATTVAAGAAAAAGVLAQQNQEPRTVRIVSEEDGWLPGQLLSVALPTARAFTGDVSITSVQITLIAADDTWQYVLAGTETSAYQGSALDQWRSLLAGGGSSAPVVTSDGGSSSVVNMETWIGGSSDTSWPTLGAFIPVPNASRYGPSTTGTYRLRAGGRARNPGVSLTFQVHDLTDGVSNPIAPAAFTSTAEVVVVLDGVLTAGHDYQLQMKGGSPDEGVFCIWATLRFVSA